MIKLVLAITFFLGFSAQATFVPQNEIKYGQLKDGPSNITETEFKQLIAELQKVYAPVVSAAGGKLSIAGQWKDETANAAAKQMFGTWQVQITGGLARRPELSPDAFTLVVCHELGHHLAGFPFAAAAPIPIPISSPLLEVWAANEGQADYFSVHSCSKKMWGAQLEKNAEFRTKVSAVAQKRCDAAYDATEERDLCYRVTVASESVSATMSALKQVPLAHFDTPNTNVVTKTDDAHPETQCRMDTLFQSALCKAVFNEKIIPGKKISAGANSIEAEKESALYTCTNSGGYQEGLRPTCWFKARM